MNKQEILERVQEIEKIAKQDIEEFVKEREAQTGEKLKEHLKYPALFGVIVAKISLLEVALSVDIEAEANSEQTE